MRAHPARQQTPSPIVDDEVVEATRPCVTVWAEAYQGETVPFGIVDADRLPPPVLEPTYHCRCRIALPTQIDDPHSGRLGGRQALSYAIAADDHAHVKRFGLPHGGIYSLTKHIRVERSRDLQEVADVFLPAHNQAQLLRHPYDMLPRHERQKLVADHGSNPKRAGRDRQRRERINFVFRL